MGSLVSPEIQQDLFGLFAPQPGVHHAPPSPPAPRAPEAPASPGPAPHTAPAPLSLTMPSPAPAGDEIVFQRSLRARNYRLTLRRDGVAVATIPLRGSEREARRFVEQHLDWLARARSRQSHKPRGADVWTIGTHVLWRGAPTEIRPAPDALRPSVRLGADTFRVPQLAGDLRPTLESHFLRLAKIELSGRAWELASQTGLGVRQIVVRNQRSRWGSCSASGTISLNWRLIQTPDSVRDYIIYHELMHLQEMNHSPRFWTRVEQSYPAWREAEHWLKQNGSLLGL